MLVEITENWGNFVLRTTTILLRMLSALLALAVLLGLGIPAAAEEVETAGTVPPAETVAATSPVETTLPPETTIATEPPETTAPPETTQTTAPPETTAPAETTRPVEEIPETTAPEVTVPVTQPTEETEEPPALLTAARSAVTVERAAAMTEGTARVQGTVVYLGGTQLVLEEDVKASLREVLTLPEVETALRSASLRLKLEPLSPKEQKALQADHKRNLVDVDDLIRKAQGALSQLGWPENNDD